MNVALFIPCINHSLKKVYKAILDAKSVQDTCNMYMRHTQIRLKITQQQTMHKIWWKRPEMKVKITISLERWWCGNRFLKYNNMLCSNVWLFPRIFVFQHAHGCLIGFWKLGQRTFEGGPKYEHFFLVAK